MDSTAGTTVSLVLGSGGARGHAHIGVIRAIVERGLEIRNVAGCSMGSLIGGVYAAGKLDTYTDWAYSLTSNDVLKLLDLSFSRQALFRGERVFDVMRSLIGDYQIQQLDRGFTAVATDIDNQSEVWLTSGSLFRAIRASTAVPGLLNPVKHHDRLLVDGGLVNPIPIAPTLNDTTDLTIAVNLNSIADSYRPDPGQEQDDPEEDQDTGYRQRIIQFVSDLTSSNDPERDSPHAAELLTRSIDVMQGSIARLKLAAYAPDKVIEIPRDACTFFEFDRAAEMAELGYRKTLEALDNLEVRSRRRSAASDS